MYVADPACRSFSHATLKMFIEIILENMPTGARITASTPCHSWVHLAWTQTGDQGSWTHVTQVMATV